ncbi:hypothetical protein [Vibrio sp. NH-UV-68]|uniref:hypothetical protein n=1 Tax=unclassified Vibrio TaxID=2614977 RepID=UPI0036F35BA0
MAKRLCKMNRKQRDEELSDLSRLVAQPKYLCRSCSRASSDKNTLCKPTSIASLASNSCNQTSFVQPAPKPTSYPISSIQPLDRDKAQAVKAVVERVKQNVANANKLTLANSIEINNDVDSGAIPELDKKALKRAQKALKKHYKLQKKQLKLAKKQRKLLDKQTKLEAKLAACKPIPNSINPVNTGLALH